MAKDKQVSLNPEINKSGGDLDLTELQEMAENVGKELFIDTKNDVSNMSKADTYFKSIIDNLFSDKDISLKTEYVDEDEQFCGTLLDFMAKKGGFPFMKKFNGEWEKKRVSLGRKSRQEIIMSLWEREKERRRQEELEFKNTLNM